MSEHVIDVSQCNHKNPVAGVWMHTTEAQTMTLSVVDIEPHAVIPEHSHPHEQIGYLVEGQFEFRIGGRSYQVTAGQIWRIPGGVPHSVVAGDRPARAIDVFYPIREDMRGE